MNAPLCSITSAKQKMVTVNIDIVEAVINELLGWDRFIEP